MIGKHDINLWECLISADFDALLADCAWFATLLPYAHLCISVDTVLYGAGWRQFKKKKKGEREKLWCAFEENTEDSLIVPSVAHFEQQKLFKSPQLFDASHQPGIVTENVTV